MGVFRRKLRDPVEGVAHVAAASRRPHQGAYAPCSMNLVVQAPGIPPTPVEHKELTRTKRWPHAGQALPVLVDAGDPSRIKVLWDQVPTGEARAQAAAEQLAQSLDLGGAAAATPPPTDQVAELERLAALHRSGALTDDEFAAAKARILGTG